MPAHDRSHYTGSYQVRARRVREAAAADPTTRCWRCGKTLAEARRLWPDRDVVWHAGHMVDGNSAMPLAPEHSVCNLSAGAQVTNRKRSLRPSRRWF
jgi:hypothetical protein